MSTWAEFAEAFTIFAKYDMTYQGVSAEHDEIYAGPPPYDVSDYDLVKLDKLGWRPSEYDCFQKFV